MEDDDRQAGNNPGVIKPVQRGSMMQIRHELLHLFTEYSVSRPNGKVKNTVCKVIPA
jgi:hypothetical protein